MVSEFCLQAEKSWYQKKLWFSPMYYVTGLNPLSPNSDQHQFSPSDIRRLSRAKSMRINKMITERKIWSVIKFSQLILKGNVWRSVWRICMWILGLKGLTYLALLQSWFLSICKTYIYLEKSWNNMERNTLQMVKINTLRWKHTVIEDL